MPSSIQPDHAAQKPTICCRLSLVLPAAPISATCSATAICLLGEEAGDHSNTYELAGDCGLPLSSRKWPVVTCLRWQQGFRSLGMGFGERGTEQKNLGRVVDPQQYAEQSTCRAKAAGGALT